MAISSMLAFMADWSTPAVIFCVLNIMIATIFMASNFKSPNHDTPSQLTRSPSLLERVKSVNLSSFYTKRDNSQHDQYQVRSDSTEYNSVSQLSTRLSLLQRVKSIDLSFSSFLNSFPTESVELSNSTTERTRSRSLMDRVKSFKLTSSFNSDQGDTSSSKDKHFDIDPHHDPIEDNNVTVDKPHRNKLANLSEKSVVTRENRSLGKLTKSGTEKKIVAASDGCEKDDVWQRPATTKSAVHDENTVDAKADDFIKRFKQQMKLQRIDSLQRLREMLHRGT